MGLFNKLKNALFEEEEIELPVRETREVPESKPVNIIKEDSVEKKPEIKKEEPKEIDPFLNEENERDLFKAENTFKFPDFDEEEFKTSYKPPIEKEEKKEPVITPKENPTRVKPITFEYDKKPKQTRKELAKRGNIEETTKEKKSFHPSPVISPVYGVLDKNYKKEDIITVKEDKTKKKFDVDEIRKKAFGTLEEDIEKSFEAPREDFYNRDNRSIDDLLGESVDEKIDIPYERRSASRETRNEKHLRVRTEEPEEIISAPNESRSRRFNEEEEEVKERSRYNEIEQSIETDNDLEVLDKESKKSEEQRFEEDTLENDLFDLIDSMYDSREDEE